MDRSGLAAVGSFVKQLGRRPELELGRTLTERRGVYLNLKDRKGGDMSEWPEDLRVREYPSPSPR